MSRVTTVIPFRQPEAIDDPLSELAREGARRMLAQVLIAGVNLYALATVVNLLLGWPLWVSIVVAALVTCGSPAGTWRYVDKPRPCCAPRPTLARSATAASSHGALKSLPSTFTNLLYKPNIKKGAAHWPMNKLRSRSPLYCMYSEAPIEPSAAHKNKSEGNLAV